MTYAKRTDVNLGAIVQIARKVGFLINVRNDSLADCDAQMCGKTELWEVKSNGGRFTARQKQLRAEGWTIWTVRTAEDVLEARERMRG